MGCRGGSRASNDRGASCCCWFLLSALVGLEEGDADGVTSARLVRNTGALGRARDRSPMLGTANGLAATGRKEAEDDVSKGLGLEVLRKLC